MWYSEIIRNKEDKFTLNLSMSGSDGDSNMWTSWFLSSRWRPMWDSSDTWLLNENGSNSILAGVTMVTALHSNNQLCSLFIVAFNVKEKVIFPKLVNDIWFYSPLNCFTLDVKYVSISISDCCVCLVEILACVQFYAWTWFATRTVLW